MSTFKGVFLLIAAFTAVIAAQTASDAGVAIQQGTNRLHKNDFFVSGTTIPLLEDRVQDSYAGLIPISGQPNETRKLFFWYWPSSARDGSDSLSIWLSGGPGCSGLLGLLSQHGAFTWLPGKEKPTANPYAWSTVSNMLYIDSPLGVGYSTRPTDVKTQFDVANELYGFLAQFYEVFPELLEKKLYITGESFAGFFVPYAANRIITASPAEKQALPINLQGISTSDALYTGYLAHLYVPMADFITEHQASLGLNSSFVASVQKASTDCGFDAILDAVTFPPAGPLPYLSDLFFYTKTECVLAVGSARVAAVEANPCWAQDDITVKCPAPHDPIEDYFPRADVQELLHIPGFGDSWQRCVNDVLKAPDGSIIDSTSPFSDTLFPSLIAALPRGITVWHGLDDMALLPKSTLITIQNLTWASAQGFQKRPSMPIVIDGEVKGIQHSERGLTYYELNNAGHLISMRQPRASLEGFKTMLGKGNLVHTMGGSKAQPFARRHDHPHDL
ncbi:alpha/beta-hydrolase [Auricularia subglabra TFB-10046 SS5]|nr:alpha/beta-hydrolase [Auricularia subglabra TFB-10046 SS5]